MFFRLIVASIVLNFLLAQSANDRRSLTTCSSLFECKYGLPALAAAVVKDGRIIAIGAVGTRVLGTEIPVAVDDRFHIGSDTKAMTATLAAKLIDEGKLSWTSTIGDVLGPIIPGLKPSFAAITLEKLLSHTSGLPTDNEEIAALYYGNAYEATSTDTAAK